MYIEQYLVKEHQQEHLQRAEELRSAHRLAALRKLEKQSKRAERQLLQAWQRVDQLRSILSTD